MKKHMDRADDENPEWTDETTARAVRIDGLPEPLQQKLRRPRGPNKAPTKVRVSMREKVGGPDPDHRGHERDQPARVSCRLKPRVTS